MLHYISSQIGLLFITKYFSSTYMYLLLLILPNIILLYYIYYNILPQLKSYFYPYSFLHFSSISGKHKLTSVIFILDHDIHF